MPTALDRVQVLLQPDEYAELTMLAKDERRKLSAMAAVLITEAIRHRIQAGTFTPHPDDPAYAMAKGRQVARMTGKDPSKAELDKLLDGMGTVSMRKVDPSLKAPKIEDVLTVKPTSSS